MQVQFTWWLFLAWFITWHDNLLIVKEFKVGNNLVLTSKMGSNVWSGEPKVTSSRDGIRDYTIYFSFNFTNYIPPKESIQDKISIHKSMSN